MGSVNRYIVEGEDMTIKLPELVQKSTTLKRLFYWNAFTLTKYMEECGQDDIQVMVMTMVETGGFGYDIRKAGDA